MKNKPPTIFMTKPVPPIEYKGARKPAAKPLQGRHIQTLQTENGLTRKYYKPKFPGNESDAQLDKVDQQSPEIPPRRIRKFSARQYSLPDQKQPGTKDHQNSWQSHCSYNVQAMLCRHYIYREAPQNFPASAREPCFKSSLSHFHRHPRNSRNRPYWTRLQDIRHVQVHTETLGIPLKLSANLGPAAESTAQFLNHCIKDYEVQTLPPTGN